MRINFIRVPHLGQDGHDMRNGANVPKSTAILASPLTLGWVDAFFDHTPIG